MLVYREKKWSVLSSYKLIGQDLQDYWPQLNKQPEKFHGVKRGRRLNAVILKEMETLSEEDNV